MGNLYVDQLRPGIRPGRRPGIRCPTVLRKVDCSNPSGSNSLHQGIQIITPLVQL